MLRKSASITLAMAIIVIRTGIVAPIERCFDTARNIDVHAKSMASTGERAVAGTTSGTIGPGQEVTWEARHLGIRQRFTSRITEYDRPRRFVDTMVRGAFRRFEHYHDFEQLGEVTIMTDCFNYEVPFAVLGKLANVLFLRSYLRKLLEHRAVVIKSIAEGSGNGS